MVADSLGDGVYDIAFSEFGEAVDDLDGQPSASNHHSFDVRTNHDRTYEPSPDDEVAPYVEFARKQFRDFLDTDLLITAFTHRSYLNERRGTVKKHNETLEFLGDAVLEIIVTDHLYRHHGQHQTEGVLTDWRSALVRTETLSETAEREGFAPLLRMSRGEEKNEGRARAQLLANCYEAVVGAVYISEGMDTAREFVDRTLLGQLASILQDNKWIDPKSRLQEITQAKGGVAPEYRILSDVGPDHDKCYTVGVYVNGELRGQGEASSKKAAQAVAAAEALIRLATRS